MLHSNERKDLQQVEASPGLGEGGEVNNSTGYRVADSWRDGEHGNIP
jgi:hypothetical protein